MTDNTASTDNLTDTTASTDNLTDTTASMNNITDSSSAQDNVHVGECVLREASTPYTPAYIPCFGFYIATDAPEANTDFTFAFTTGRNITTEAPTQIVPGIEGYYLVSLTGSLTTLTNATTTLFRNGEVVCYSISGTDTCNPISLSATVIMDGNTDYISVQCDNTVTSSQLLLNIFYLSA